MLKTVSTNKQLDMVIGLAWMRWGFLFKIAGMAQGY
jgi:hypothetical protein